MLNFIWLKELPQLDGHVSKSAQLTPFENIGEEEAEDPPEEYGSLADVFLYIDYVDANGRASRRAITIKGEAQSGGQPSIYAWCHVCKQIRKFRLDRIQAITTEDGEYFSPPAMFWKSIGFEPRFEIAVSRPPRDDKLTALDIKRQFAPELVVLAALSKSDGAMHSNELDKIINHVERELEWSRRSLSNEEVSALRAHVGRMRITAERIEECIDSLLAGRGKQRLHGKQRDRFFKAAIEVVAADGLIHSSEMAFLDYLQAHLE